MATDELAAKLQRRTNVIEKAEACEEEGVDFADADLPSLQVFNPYTEFKEFSRKQILDFQKIFNKYDVGKDKFIDFHELKLMMEKLGSPQTHLALKEMIREVDEDQDDKISFREFLLIFRKAEAGELAEGSGLYDMWVIATEVDVDKEGVKGAKHFFEAKIGQQSKSNQFEQEIREEQEEKRREAEEKKKRRAEFKEKASLFKTA